GDGLLEGLDVGDHAHLAPLADLVQDRDGAIQGITVQATEAFVDEEGVQTTPPGAGLDYIR
ncbi:MAG: hypothetical protein H6Q00_2719, partial [Holophagaceae bacterium]|nr:hypothetical protein [Holophagaceae bacterium]